MDACSAVSAGGEISLPFLSLLGSLFHDGRMLSGCQCVPIGQAVKAFGLLGSAPSLHSIGAVGMPSVLQLPNEQAEIQVNASAVGRRARIVGTAPFADG
jgi:hypothetical protein